jgi:putative NADH-flavin reductase
VCSGHAKLPELEGPLNALQYLSRRSNMKIALIGATGFVGSAVLQEALNRGHEVTAIVRHPEKLQSQMKLHAQKGDVQNEDEVARLVAGHDAVISAFNPGWTNSDLYSQQVKGTRAIINGVKRAGVKRLLFVGGAGSLEVKPGVQSVDTPSCMS